MPLPHFGVQDYKINKKQFYYIGDNIIKDGFTILNNNIYYLEDRIKRDKFTFLCVEDNKRIENWPELYLLNDTFNPNEWLDRAEFRKMRLEKLLNN